MQDSSCVDSNPSFMPLAKIDAQLHLRIRINIKRCGSVCMSTSWLSCKTYQTLSAAAGFGLHMDMQETVAEQQLILRNDRNPNHFSS